MDMSTMDMGTPGLPSDEFFAKTYWYFVGGAIALGALINLKEQILYRQRLFAASKSLQDPARPKNLFWRSYATATATVREACYYQAPFLPSLKHRFPRLARFPPLGRILLIAANLALLLSLVFYGFKPQDTSVYENIGYRAGWVTASQVPLIFLLAGKRNIVGFLTGVSYERLNWIHRWVARSLFITASIHFSYWLKDWERWDYVAHKFEIDVISRRGLAAWCILLWIVLSSFAPSRWFSYEFFVVQHIVTTAGFLAAIMLHTPKEVHVYIWIPVGFWAFDRTVRSAYILYNNLSIFHPKKSSAVCRSSVFACKAVFYSLPDRATRITIPNPPFTWKAGQHAFVSCHTLVPLQSHPFTIVSLPSDDSLEFIVRAHAGGTSRFYRHASEALPPLSDASKTVFIDGPYGRVRPLEQFDSVVLLAGSTGASYTIPLLRDLVRRRRNGLSLVTRKIRFIWVIKRKAHVSWFCKAIADTLEAGNILQGLEIEATIYITCDDTLTAEIPEDSEVVEFTTKGTRRGYEPKEIEKDKGIIIEEETCGGNGRCCCQDVVEDEDDIVEDGTEKKTCCCNPTRAEDVRPSSSSFAPDLKRRTSTTSSSTAVSESRPSSLQSSLELPECVHILTGRPAVRNVIEKELERALGESAVVVCGPVGLVNSTRKAVVRLSDERAVHKGTGAQGIYLHTESFSL